MSRTPKKRSIATRMLRLLFILIGSIIVFVAFIPTIISSSWGQSKIIGWINQSIPGTVKLDSLSLTWQGPQQLQGLVLLDAQGQPVLTLENIQAKASLLSLIRHASTAGSIEWKALNIHLVGDSEGNTNLMRALDKSCCEDSFKPVKPVAIDLRNTDGSINLDDSTPMTLQMSGQTQQNELQGQFLVDAELRGVSLQEMLKSKKSSEWLTSRPDAEFKIRADIANFPVELLDQILSLREPTLAGLLTEVFGNTLNLTINQKTAANGISLSINGKTPTLNLNADVLIDHMLTLTKPAQAFLQLTPSSANQLMVWLKVESPWRLSSPTAANLTFTNLQAPLALLEQPLHEWDMQLIGFAAGLDIDQADLINNNSNEPLALRNLHATVTAEPNTPKASVKVAGEALHANQPAKIQLNLSVPKKALRKGLSQLSLREIAVQGEITKAPIALLDPFLTSSTSPSAILGSYADIAFSIQTENERPLASVTFKSERLEIPRVAFWIDQYATLYKSAPIILKVNPGLISQFFPQQNVQLQGPATAQLTLNTFSLPLQYLASPLSTTHHWDIDATLKISSARFSQAPTIGPFSINDFSAHFSANRTSTPELTTSFQFQPEGQTLFTPLIGKNAHIKTSTALQMGTNGKLSTDALKVQITSDAAIKKLGTLWIIDLASERITVNFAGSTRQEKSAVADLEGMEFDSFNETDTERLRKKTMAGKFRGSASLSQWTHNNSANFQGAVLEVRAKADALPTELLSVLSGQQDLSPILGNEVDLFVDACTPLSGQDEGTVSLDLTSANLACSLNLALGNTIQLNKSRPATLSFTLTPQSYAALRRHFNASDTGQFVLAEPTTATLKLHSLRIPKSHSFSQVAIEGDFSLDRLVGKDSLTQNTITLNSLQGHVSSHHLAEAIHFDMQTQGHNGQGTRTAWKMTGILSNGFNPDGSVNKQDLSLSFNANIQALPVPLLCQFVCLDPKLKQKIEAIIGPTLNANVQAQLQHMNGPFFAEVQGNNGRLTLDAYLNDSIMTLNKDMTAELNVTPELGDHVLKDLIPILGGMLAAEHPIYLTIHKEGFYLPLRNASALTAQIQKGSLNLGKVRFSDQSQIAKAFALLMPASSSQLVWITPAYFSLAQGVLTLERVDMLINSYYPIAAWGNVDIGKDRVDMTIALSGAAIAKAFHVPGISNSYFLQLPLKGRLNHASIDKTKAVGRLSALAAHSQGGPQGAVLGTVLDIATGGLSENAVPSPTTNPLPWSDLMAQTETSAEPQRNANKKSSERKDSEKKHPIKELEQGASSLFKKIFR